MTSLSQCSEIHSQGDGWGLVRGGGWDPFVEDKSKCTEV